MADARPEEGEAVVIGVLAAHGVPQELAEKLAVKAGAGAASKAVKVLSVRTHRPTWRRF